MTNDWEDEVVSGSSRFPVTIMGVAMGTAAGFDVVDHNEEVFSDFVPHPGINLIAGEVTVNYDSGLFEYYNEAGEVTVTFRIYDVLKDILE